MSQESNIMMNTSGYSMVAVTPVFSYWWKCDKCGGFNPGIKMCGDEKDHAECIHCGERFPESAFVKHNLDKVRDCLALQRKRAELEVSTLSTEEKDAAFAALDASLKYKDIVEVSSEIIKPSKSLRHINAYPLLQFIYRCPQCNTKVVAHTVIKDGRALNRLMKMDSKDHFVECSACHYSFPRNLFLIKDLESALELAQASGATIIPF